MTSQPLPPRTPERIRSFLRAFFGDGNHVWPDLDTDTKTGRNLAPYLQVLWDNSDVPVVLPRRWPTPNDMSAYVIAQDRSSVTAVTELLTAFVGPSYTRFDGRLSHLDPRDPVDNAVLQFAGPGTTFVLRCPIPQREGSLWSSLRLMQQTMAKRPTRSWRLHKPLGRLLAEFEAALAAGDHSASAQSLDHLAVTGGLTGPNMAHLRIKRLARLGRDAELLRMPGLADVLAADPPVPVKDAVLTALYTTTVARPLTDGDLSAARAILVESGQLVPALMSSDPRGLGPQALSVIALAAWARADSATLQRLRAHPTASSLVADLAPALAAAIAPAPPEPDAGAVPIPAGPSSPSGADTAVVPLPQSWPDLVRSIVHNHRDAARILENQAWREWPAPAASDNTIVEILRGLDDNAAGRAWSLVGPFVDADGYAQPATRSAHELIHIGLLLGALNPGDLAGLVALVEIVLRGAPDRNTYAILLDDLRADSARWVCPERATLVLDLADLLVRAACPDKEARLRCALALVEPLHAHAGRLDTDQSALARQLCQELGTGLDWPPADAVGDRVPPLADLPGRKILLYSLDQGALDRAATLLHHHAPNCDVQLSSDRVASPRLRQHIRRADLIVLATRCATHAATGYIRANARTDTVVTEADGSGSASLLRAAVTGLREHLTRAADT